MNKMAAAFLSLFSLILIVGVLYLTSPVAEIEVSKLDETTPVSTTSTQTNEKALTNQNSSIEQKAEALKEEMQNQENLQLIATLEQAFTNNNQQCEVTINEKNIRIQLKGIKEDENKAAEIIKEAYNLTKHKYFIEVAFQEK